MKHLSVPSFVAGAVAATMLLAVPVSAAMMRTAGTDPHPNAFDGTVPSLTVPPPVFLIGTSIDAAPPPGDPICYFPDPWNWKIPMRMQWTGTDTTSGIAGYELWERSGQAPEMLISGPSMRTSYDFFGGNYASDCGGGSHSSSFWVKATDNRGNSASTTDAANEIVHVWQEDGTTVEQLVDPLPVSKSAGWSTANCVCSNGGATYFSTAAGSSLTYTVTTTRPGQVVGIVVGKDTDRGDLEISVDGGLADSVNTHAGVEKDTVIAWQQLLRVGSHTLTLTNVGTAGHPRIDIDSILLTFGQFHQAG